MIRHKTRRFTHMRTVWLSLVFAWALFQPARAERSMEEPVSAPDTVIVVIETEVGDMVVELYAGAAPVTVANFLRYVDTGHYRGGSFYRTVRADNQPHSPVKIDVIQAGVHPLYSIRNFPPIPLERTSDTGLRHRNGTLSMARLDPDTATAEFFICVGDQPELDYGGRRNPDGQGFAAFGQVIEGMEVVRQIHGTRAEGQAIMPPVRIHRIERLSPESPEEE